MAAEENMGSSSPPPSSPSTSYTSYPILAITLFGILTTAILLVSYYVFVIKCCMNWRPPGLSISRSRRRSRLWPPPTTIDRRGLGESAIRAIPTVRFRGGEGGTVGKSFFLDCAICLNEFEEEERLRILPSCTHTFHIDCIDTWLQTNDNCPICRSDIARAEHVTIPPLFMAHFHRGQDTVIDVRADLVARGDNSPRTELSVPPTLAEKEEGPPPRKPGQRFVLQKEVGKLQHVCSMGDECIDVRGKDEEFHTLQPMRRSISMDSSNDRKLYMAVQEILRGQNPHLKGMEGSSSSGGSGRFRRSFFSFGYGRSCRNAVLPIHVVP